MDTMGRMGECAGSASPTEDDLTKSIERYTATIPSTAFLGMALGSIGVSLVAQTVGRGKWGNFIAQWAPTLLMMGVYNKLLKVQGHDQQDRGWSRSSSQGAVGISNRPLADEQTQQGHLPPRGQGTGSRSAH